MWAPLENSQNHQEAFVTPKRQIPSSYFHHLANFLTGWDILNNARTHFEKNS